MIARRTIGRPTKMDVKTIAKLTDMLQYSSSVSDACRYAGISRDTFYRHCRNEKVFAEMVETAKANQYRLMSFLTFY